MYIGIEKSNKSKDNIVCIIIIIQNRLLYINITNIFI